MLKHVHAELIKAWADGAEIEYYSQGLRGWYTIDSPVWGRDTEYRIKPKELKYKVGDYVITSDYTIAKVKNVFPESGEPYSLVGWYGDTTSYRENWIRQKVELTEPF